MSPVLFHRSRVAALRVVLLVLIGIAVVGGAASRVVAAEHPGDAVEAALAQQAVPEQAAESFAFMPLVGRGMTLAMLVPPQTAVVPSETPTSVHTPTASDTPTPSATFTPVPSPTPTVGPLDAEEDSPRVTLDGDWQQLSDTRASGGAYASTNTEGDTLTVRFTGDHIVIYRTLGPDGGRASIDIDGTSYGYLYCDFYQRQYQIPAVIDNLPVGAHTLTLTVSDRSPSGSTGTTVNIDRLQAPGPYGFTDEHNEALERSNYYRDLTGLPRIRSDRAIHLAAQGHAEYDARQQGIAGHRQTPGQPGYFGTRFSDRLDYYGYDAASGEVMYWSTQHSPAHAVDGWVDTVYHRLPFVAHNSTDLGYGEAPQGRLITAVIDFGARDHVPPTERLIVTYPVDGQTDVPLGWRHTTEVPDPLPGQPADVGYPISLHITQPGGSIDAMLPWAWDDVGRTARTAAPTDWNLATATLTDGGGATVPAYVIDESNDEPGYLRADVVFVMARAYMAPNTRYTTHITGTDSRDVPFDVTWSFTTGGAAVNGLGHASGGRVGSRQPTD